MSLALLGSDTPDGNLSMDEDDFVELVVDAPLSLHYLESVYSLKAVNQMVGNEGEDGFAEVLYNANDAAEYVLATAEEGGYAIFHRMTGALMEAGEFGASPYAGQSGKKYYFGPSNYAVKDVNGVTTDIMRGGVMTTEQITAMHQYMAEKRALVVDRFETKSYANMLSALQEAEVIKQQGKTRDGSGIVNEGEFAGNPYEVLAPLSSFSHVDNYQIIQSQTANIDYLENLYGSCAFVANVIMLRYFDETVAPGLIPNDINNVPYAWVTKCSDKNISYRENGLVKYFSCVINDKLDNVYEQLTKFTMAVSRVYTFGLGGWNIDRYNDTLPPCTQISNDSSPIADENTRFSTVKGKIDDNIPVELFFWTYDSNNIVSGAHIVVAYGYCENENGKFYKAHFGYSQAYSSIVVPHYLTDSKINFFTITANAHTNGNHNCGYSNCFAQIEGHNYNPMSNGLGHFCACGETHTHEGLGIIESWEDYGTFDASEYRELLMQGNSNDTHHFSVCNHCIQYYVPGENFQEMNTSWDVQYQDIVGLFPSFQWTNSMAPHRMGPIVVSGGTCMTECSDCGHLYELSWRHKGYRYTNVNALFHDVYCIGCNEYMGRGEHMFNSKNVCTVCGGGAMQPIPIT